MNSSRPFCFSEAGGKQPQYYLAIIEAFSQGIGLVMDACQEHREI